MTGSSLQYALLRLNPLVKPQVSTRRLVCWQQCRYTTKLSSQRESAQEIDSSLRDRQYIYSEHLSVQPLVLLRNALMGYLPPSIESDEGDASYNWLHLGYQHLFFRPPLTPEMICSDGTDTKFLPGPESVWKYRLWAGGSVRYLRQFPYPCHPNFRAYLAESVLDVSIVDRNNRADKAFVTIERRVTVPEISLTPDQIQSKFFPRNHEERNSDVGLIETEKICFLREQPASLQDRRRIKPPSNPAYTHTMMPTRNLLFQFSAMTYNAHSIHLDRELARQEYGAEDLVVHGPLTMVLMLEFLRITLQRAAGLDHESADVYFVPKAINYSNLHAIYVDRPLTLCCRPSSSRSGEAISDRAQTWQVWIEVGNGTNASCAVKATVEVGKIEKKDLQLDQSKSRSIES